MSRKRKRKKSSVPMIALWVFIVILLATLLTIIYFLLKKTDNAEPVQEIKKTENVSTEPIRDESNMPERNTAVHSEEEASTEIKEAREMTTEEENDYLKTIADYKAGDIVEEEVLDPDHMDKYFISSPITDEIFSRIHGLSYKSNCTVPKEDLRYLKVLHYNFDEEIQVGELIVNTRLEKDMLEIFQELFDEKYEIEKMYLVDEYGADDSESIDHNNTSCFNFRRVTNGSTLSNHAGGCAIDINPQQNPYVTFNSDGSKHWVHSNADPYIDREGSGEHMITHSDTCYRIFTEHGFSWGGDWNNPKDYQHFEKEVAHYE